MEMQKQDEMLAVGFLSPHQQDGHQKGRPKTS